MDGRALWLSLSQFLAPYLKHISRLHTTPRISTSRPRASLCHLFHYHLPSLTLPSWKLAHLLGSLAPHSAPATLPPVLIHRLASRCIVLAHSFELTHSLIQFAPKCSGKPFFPISLSSHPPRESLAEAVGFTVTQLGQILNYCHFAMDSLFSIQICHIMAGAYKLSFYFAVWLHSRSCQ